MSNSSSPRTPHQRVTKKAQRSQDHNASPSRDTDGVMGADTSSSLIAFSAPDIWGHISKRWPTSTPFIQVAKVAEEAGEAIGAAIKHGEGRRTRQDILDELADTIIAASAAIQSYDEDVSGVVNQRWAEVVTR